MQKALKHIAKSNLSSITSVSSKYLIGNCSRITSEYQKMRDIKPKSTHNVCIEGNIGCGKTTFLNYFSQFNDVDVLHEPVNKWMNLNDYNLLDLMYKDPNRWCHLFQTYVQLTMMEQHLKPSTASTKIMERSLFSARHCFVENLYRTKKMSEVEYKVYCEWFRLILKIIDCRVDLIVYLRTDPKILNERIISRARTEEAQIPLEYLESLHRLHEEWLIEGPLKTSIPVLVIDANASLTEMKEIYKKHIQEIVRGSSTPERSPLKAIQPSSLSPAGEKHERGSQAQERLTLSSSCSHSQQ